MSKNWQDELSDEERAAVATARRYVSLAPDPSLDTYRHDLSALAKTAGMLDEKEAERRPELFTGSIEMIDPQKSFGETLKRELAAELAPEGATRRFYKVLFGTHKGAQWLR